MGELSVPLPSNDLLQEEEEEQQQQQEKENIVLTGFGLFSGHKVNSSWEAVKELQREGVGDEYNVIAEKLEVEYRCIDERVPELWKTHKPKLMVHCGLSAIAKELTLEQLAHRDGYDTKDVTGNHADNQSCCPCGDDVVKTSLCLGRVCNAVNESESGIATVISSDPGRFLCDYTYYKSLSIDPARTIFMHVPPLDNPYTAQELASAMKIAILEMLKQLDEEEGVDDVLESLHINEIS